MFVKNKLKKITYDPAALETLIRDNYADIYQYCYCHVGNKFDAQDITQEVFLKFFSALDRYVEYGKVKNYLYVIARNKVRDHWKKKSPILMEDISKAGLNEVYFTEEETINRITVLDMIATLDDMERELIILRYYQELTIREISSIVGKPASSVRYILRNAEKALRLRWRLKMDKKLNRKLHTVQIPAYEESALLSTIQEVKKIQLPSACHRMSSWQFFVDQLRFIRKRTWGAKIVFSLLALTVIGLNGVSLNNWIWPMTAIFGPLLCLLNANEIYQTFQPGLLELQMTTRYGCNRILWVRLVSFGVCDLLFLIAMVLLLIHSHGVVFWYVLLYGSVPYNIMCFGSLIILNHCREENALLYCAGFGVSLIGIIAMAKISGLNLYTESRAAIWFVLELTALFGTITELIKTTRKVKGNVYEINTGSSF